MEYSVNQLAKMSDVSPRTLRYYDQIGLLVPARNDPNDYRIYGENEVDRLQQILYYRELGVSLEDIESILDAPDFDLASALQVIFSGSPMSFTLTPINMADRNFYPLRELCENMNAAVDWDGSTRTVTIALADKTVNFAIDKTTYTGHAHATTTMNIYAHQFQTAQARACEAVSNALNLSFSA